MKKVPRNTPNENLEASRFWGSQKVSAPVILFSTLWRRLGDFGRFVGPLEIGLGAKNGPKNSIRLLFGAPGRSKGGKNRFWKAFGKNRKI